MITTADLQALGVACAGCGTLAASYTCEGCEAALCDACGWVSTANMALYCEPCYEKRGK